MPIGSYAAILFTMKHSKFFIPKQLAMRRSLFTAVIFLMLIHLHGASFQNEGTCTTEEVRRGLVDKQLAALGCENYTCVCK